VPYDKEMIQSAPSIEAEEHLSSDEEENLYRHYSLDLYSVAFQSRRRSTTRDGGWARSEDRLVGEENDAFAGHDDPRWEVTTPRRLRGAAARRHREGPDWQGKTA
jgi:hypothetical protein